MGTRTHPVQFHAVFFGKMPKQWIGTLAPRFEIGAPSPRVGNPGSTTCKINFISIFADIWPRAADHEIQGHQ